MMKYTIIKYKAVTLFIALFGFIGMANAALISSDYQNTGDQLITIDEAQKLEWLDLSLTDAWTINSVNNSNYVMNDGFQLASQSQVEHMFNNHFTSFSSNVYWGESNTDSTSQSFKDAFSFASLFGFTATNYSGGFFFDANNELNMTSVSLNNGSYVSIFSPDNGWQYRPDYGNSSLGWFLVRPYEPKEMNRLAAASAIPEPSLAGLLLFGFLGLALRRKK